jgi:predicted ATPase
LRELVLRGEGRLVTLTGVGGCGKTRLALGVAAAVVGSFSDGAWLVPLAPLADPLLVPQAVASVLGVRERSDQSLPDALVAYLEKRQLLLVLDNCEHLLRGCAELVEALLQGCPTLRVLATSREPLRMSGERAWRVPSLAAPDPRSSLGPDELVRYPAVQLFVQRAQAVQSDFVATPRVTPAVATICARLEALPLAIELAAAWVRALGVEQIVERLDDVFGLLVGGSRTAPSRQQTMQATMDWSYGLLAEPERVLFQRLAVFVGGWSLEAAEAVCSGSRVEPRELLTLLTRLVDASLVQVEERDPRAGYRLLEPIRLYAGACLIASGEFDVVRRQHAAYFLLFAQRWETDANVGGPGRPAAYAALEHEQDNLRTALRWCVEKGDAEKGLSLGKAQWNFWVVRGLLTEGRASLTELTALPDAAKAPTMRSVALSISASLAYRQGSYATALAIYREVLPRLWQAHDPWVLECALMDLEASSPCTRGTIRPRRVTGASH